MRLACMWFINDNNHTDFTCEAADVPDNARLLSLCHMTRRAHDGSRLRCLPAETLSELAFISRPVCHHSPALT